jgi:ABC-type sugar transport system ATPase subunit
MQSAARQPVSPDGVRPGEIVAALRRVNKSFAGVHAVKDATLELRAGEVHCLVGENGAGKSTIVKIISGVHKPDSGEYYMRSQDNDIGSPQAALDLGVRTIYQENSLVPDMTVAENIALGHEPVHRPRFVMNLRERRRNAARVLDDLGIEGISPSDPVSSLGVARQQLVEIAKAVARPGGHLMIMDEPTAPLTPDEIDRLFAIVRRLRERGMSILYITHRLEELEAIGDVITVMRDGSIVAAGNPRTMSRRDVIQEMVGRRIENLYPERKFEPGQTIIEIKDGGASAGKPDAPDLVVRRGEVVGLFGLIGAGRTEMVRALIGADAGGDYEVRFKGDPARFRSPGHAMRSGLTLVPEDRKGQGIVPEMSIATNIALGSLGKLAHGPVLSNGTIRRMASSYVERLNVRCHSPGQLIMNLSGGNQQKCILARALACEPDLLILDEPTRGVDVGARTELYELMDEVCAAGHGVLMISSDMPEVLGVSNRLYVMRAGRIVGELEPRTATQQDVMALAVGEVEPAVGSPAAG